MSRRILNIFLFALFLFGFYWQNGVAIHDHLNEKPEDKYSAEFNKQASENHDSDALKEQETVELAERFILTGKDMLSIGKYKSALWNFDRSYNYQPLNPENLESRAKCHLKMENYTFAFLDANEALKFDPDNKSARKTKVMAMIGLKRRSEAIIHEIEKTNDIQLIEKYKDAVTQTEQNDQDDMDDILHEANINFAMNECQAALTLYNKVLPHLLYGSKLYTDALTHRLKSLHCLKRVPEAYLDATELLELATDDKFLYHTMRAMLLLDLDRVESIAEFDKVIELDQDKDRAEKVKDIMAGAKMEMHRRRQLILDRAASGIPTSQNKITELIIEPAKQLNNFITIKAADGKKYEAKTFDDLMELLSSYHSRITRVTLNKVTFDKDFVHVLTTVDSVLWTGILNVQYCDFTELSQKEVLNLFRHTLKPESLYLIDNVGLTSDTLNKAFKEHLLDCTLVLFGDETDDMELDPKALVDFLHRPTGQITGLQRLMINPEFIDGGVNKFVEKIVVRFHTDTEPAPFLLQFTKVISLLFPSGTAIVNAQTKEWLAHETFDEPSLKGFVKQTTLRRYANKENGVPHGPPVAVPVPQAQEDE
ncbi:hypothetical protein Ddc_13675 [Ditylenchus destructor]|nr:hypothetical protein Ddc_13675 [Ditylenchus destructor]